MAAPDTKDKRWWLWLWLLLGGSAIALVVGGLYWRYNAAMPDVNAPTWVSMKVKAGLQDGRELTATVEVAAPAKSKEALEARRQIITTEVTSYLVGIQSDVLADVEKREALLRSLKRKINAQLPEDAKVDKVLFSNFLVGT